VLIGENSMVSATDVFSSPGFASFVREVRKHYDSIVIDTPSVLVVPDARVIAQFADAVLFTVKWDSTSKTEVAEGLRMFESVNQTATGIVLNQISPAGMQSYGHGKRYRAYAEYGKAYYPV
jgi:Mrp family chromosome partitioning ATPase